MADGHPGTQSKVREGIKVGFSNGHLTALNGWLLMHHITLRPKQFYKVEQLAKFILKSACR